MFNLTYLRHDVDAGCDPKCIALIAEHGMESYGRWWLLLETMARSSDGFIDLSKPGQERMLVRTLWLGDVDDLRAYLLTLADLGLVDAGMLEGGKVMSNSFLQRRDEMIAAYENGKKGGRPKKAEG